MLNSRTKHELEKLGIQDMTDTILEVGNFLNIRNLMLQLENKCQNLEVQIKKFHEKFTILC